MRVPVHTPFLRPALFCPLPRVGKGWVRYLFAWAEMQPQASTPIVSRRYNPAQRHRVGGGRACSRRRLQPSCHASLALALLLTPSTGAWGMVCEWVELCEWWSGRGCHPSLQSGGVQHKGESSADNCSALAGGLRLASTNANGVHERHAVVTAARGRPPPVREARRSRCFQPSCPPRGCTQAGGVAAQSGMGGWKRTGHGASTPAQTPPSACCPRDPRTNSVPRFRDAGREEQGTDNPHQLGTLRP